MNRLELKPRININIVQISGGSRYLEHSKNVILLEFRNITRIFMLLEWSYRISIESFSIKSKLKKCSSWNPDYMIHRNLNNNSKDYIIVSQFSIQIRYSLKQIDDLFYSIAQIIVWFLPSLLEKLSYRDWIK